MKYLICLLMLVALSANAKVFKKINLLPNGAQNFTDTWTNVGSQFNTLDADAVGIYFYKDNNDSSSLQIRALGILSPDSGSTTYSLPIGTVSATSVSLDEEVYNIDANSSTMVVQINTGSPTSVVPFVQLQIKAGTVGATAAQLKYLNLIKSVSGIK